MPNVKIKNYLNEEKSYANVNKVWLTRDGGGQETVFAEQTVEFFDLTEDGMPGIWCCPGHFSTAFSIGDTVTVKFDGTEYTCIAFDGAVIGFGGFPTIGNTSIAGVGEDTGEPFIAANAVVSSEEIEFEFYTTLGGDSHVLAISKATGGGSSLVPFTYGELVENAQISLDFSGGNQKLSVPDGSLVKEATILKPDNLTPENIKQGVDIAGVSGRYVPETEVATVNLDFSSGDMTVRPSAGKTFSGVDILKPATLIPANVAKDVTIAGITGTHEGGGGGASEPYVEYELNKNGLITAAKLYGFSHIPSYFFNGFSSLKEVDLSHSPGIKSIGDAAFYNCQALTDFAIPSSVTSIGSSAFYFCRSLTSIVIPDSVTSIGYDTFRNCYNLTSIVIPDGVTSIGGNAFYNCQALTDFAIPSSVTSIGSAAFYGCYKLIEVYNLSSLKITAGDTSNGYVGYYAKNVYTAGEGASKLFTDSNGYICYVDGDTRYLMGYTGSEAALTLPPSCHGESYAIYKYAFSSSSLTSIVIPDSVTSIGDNAFHSCLNLTSIVIPDGVTSIGNYAVGSCYGLTSVTIGSGVTSIGSSAFAYCDKLTSATFKDTTTWYVTQTAGASSGTTLSSSSLANTSTAATWLRSTYYQYYWYKN